MTRPLSNDLRQRLRAAGDGGLTRRAAAERFGVAPSTAGGGARGMMPAPLFHHFHAAASCGAEVF